MRKYLVKRLLVMIPMLIGISIVTYIIMSLAPGDAASMYLNPEITAGSPELLDQMRKNLGLDQPVYVRYFLWLKEAVRGNFGYSYASGRPVLTEITSRIGVTVTITLLALVVSFIGGLAIGIICARNQYKATDYILSVLSLVGISLPNFWLAMLLMMLFTNTLGWLPSVGLRDVLVTYETSWAQFVDYVKHLIMPVTALALSQIGRWARYQRASYLEVIHDDYIRTAKSKGMTARRITWVHAFRNSALPIITLLGSTLPSLIGGAFIIETMFSIPGLGRLGTDSAMSRDYPVIMGVTFFSALLVMVGMFLSDILYSLVDPRIRYGQGGEA